MPQPIVPVEVPQSHRFDSKKRNDLLLTVRISKLELSFSQSLNLETIEKLCNTLECGVDDILEFYKKNSGDTDYV